MKIHQWIANIVAVIVLIVISPLILIIVLWNWKAFKIAHIEEKSSDQGDSW